MSDTENSDGERPDPEDDPSACSICGCHIGQFTGEYCDGCAREIGVRTGQRTVRRLRTVAEVLRGRIREK